MDEDNKSKASSKDISHITEAINQLLSFSNCPSKFRGYVDALLGISRGAIEIEITDHALASHARGDASSISKEGLTKWIQRMRKNFDSWQRNLGIVFIECESGGYEKTTGSYRKSHYKLPIIQYATTVINEAKKSAGWETDPQYQIGLAALEVIDGMKATQAIIPQKRSYSGFYKTEVRTSMRTAKAKLKRALDFLEDKDMTISAQDEQLIKDLENLLKRIRRQVRQ
ncbi:MAG TPA: hypothetical protein VLJ61_06220 [Pyrinomonadaceae bacterium]|nr:hypothetical protein [Pyrinomonadaceae bacterium]